MSDATTDWATPWDEFAKLYRGRRFTIDAAADKTNAKVRPHSPRCPMVAGSVQCRAGRYCLSCERYIGRYFTKETDGLAQRYGAGDVVFCNPPYDGASLWKWVQLAAISSRRGARWLLVLPPSIDAAWFHDYVWDDNLHRPREGVDLWYWRGRIHFVDPTPKKRNGARQGTMIVEFYPR